VKGKAEILKTETLKWKQGRRPARGAALADAEKSGRTGRSALPWIRSRRKWLIINERYFEKFFAMDRQCPLLCERMQKVEMGREKRAGSREQGAGSRERGAGSGEQGAGRGQRGRIRTEVGDPRAEVAGCALPR